MKINVQFSDETHQHIISYFGSPQDPVDFPNQGVIATSDPRWAEYYNSIPESMRDGLPQPTQESSG